MNSLKYIVAVTIVFIVFVASCKKEAPLCSDVTNPECPNYNPCYGKSMADANFTFGEVCVMAPKTKDGVYYDSIIYSDTIKSYNMVEFSVVQEDYDSLKWFIGSEVLTTSKIRRRNFPIDRNITVTLIVWKTADTTCFPNAPNSDTLVKTFYSARYPVYYQKRYKGIISSNPNDSIFVSFKDSEFFGLPLACDGFPGIGGQLSYFMGYRRVIISGREVKYPCSYNNMGLRLNGYATDTGFEADYTYVVGPFLEVGEIKKEHFTGKIDS
tara:strand:+ start:22773 stop:23576 length:804 start_codon:yes stop_codon:yes gene_type:complete